MYISVHGLVHVLNAETAFIRTSWIAICVLVTAFCCFQFSNVISEFLQKGTHIQLKLNRDEGVPFPVVSVCNLNAYRKEASNSIPGLAVLNAAYQLASKTIGDEKVSARQKRDTSTKTFNMQENPSNDHAEILHRHKRQGLSSCVEYDGWIYLFSKPGKPCSDTCSNLGSTCNRSALNTMKPGILKGLLYEVAEREGHPCVPLPPGDPELATQPYRKFSPQRPSKDGAECYGWAPGDMQADCTSVPKQDQSLCRCSKAPDFSCYMYYPNGPWDHQGAKFVVGQLGENCKKACASFGLTCNFTNFSSIMASSSQWFYDRMDAQVWSYAGAGCSYLSSKLDSTGWPAFQSNQICSGYQPGSAFPACEKSYVKDYRICQCKESSACPAGYAETTLACYKLFTVSTSRDDAEQTCQQEDSDGHLPYFQTDAEFAEFQLLSKGMDLWITGSMGLPTSQYKQWRLNWDQSVTVPYQFWMNGEPGAYNVSEEPRCLQYFDAFKGMDDFSCDSKQPFYCQIGRSDSGCPGGYIEKSTACYKYFTTTKDQAGAEAVCVAEGGHLPFFEDQSEFTEFQELSFTNAVWIAGILVNPDGQREQWRLNWNISIPTLHLQWSPLQPSVGGKCLATNASDSKASSNDCSQPRKFYCQIYKANEADCQSLSCNHGVCQVINGKTGCVCDVGFGGLHCDRNIDDCENNQCHPTATCIDAVNGYSCQCAPGYVGPLCDQDIDECLSNSCQSSEQCADYENNYSCVQNAQIQDLMSYILQQSSQKDVFHDTESFNTVTAETALLLASSANISDLVAAGFSLDSMFEWCYTDFSTDCHRIFSSSFFDLGFGNCYVFNNISNAYRAVRAGPDHGLRFRIRFNTDQYQEYVETAGGKVILSMQGDQAFPDTEGFALTPGFKTSLVLTYTDISRLSPPYGDCPKSLDNQPKYLYQSVYSQQRCERSLIQFENIKLCGCAHPSLPVPPGHKACKEFKQFECLMQNGTQAANISDILMKSCPERCSEGMFHSVMTMTRWPSKSFVVPHCEHTNSTCRMLFAKNRAVMEIYYVDLGYLDLQEIADKTIVSILSQIGGILGITLGMSLISVWEILLLINKVGPRK